MSNRCPKCGKNNYGDVKKCSFCGAPLTFIPGVEESEEISEEDIQEKMSKMKVKRIRNPMLIGIGGIVALIGLVLMVILYLSMMSLVYSPSGVDPSYEMGSWNYNVDGGRQMIFGEITAITTFEDTNWDVGGNHGYKEMTAYEIDGDGDDSRVYGFREGNVKFEPDVWIYSDEDLGDVGDNILIVVESENNDFGEERAVFKGHAPWGGHGYLAGWIWLMPGLLLLIGGLIVGAIGLIGKADKSMDRLLQEDKELRRQQIMLREAARKKMDEKRKMSQWGQQDPYAQDPSQSQTPPEAQSQPAPVQQGQPQAPPEAQPAPTSQQGGQQSTEDQSQPAPVQQGQPQAPPEAQPVQPSQQGSQQFPEAAPPAQTTPQGQTEAPRYQPPQ